MMTTKKLLLAVEFLETVELVDLKTLLRACLALVHPAEEECLAVAGPRNIVSFSDVRFQCGP